MEEVVACNHNWITNPTNTNHVFCMFCMEDWDDYNRERFEKEQED